MQHMALQVCVVNAAVSGQAVQQVPRLATLQAVKPSGGTVEQKLLCGWRQLERSLLHAFLLCPLPGIAAVTMPVAAISRF